MKEGAGWLNDWQEKTEDPQEKNAEEVKIQKRELVDDEKPKIKPQKTDYSDPQGNLNFN